MRVCVHTYMYIYCIHMCMLTVSVKDYNRQTISTAKG